MAMIMNLLNMLYNQLRSAIIEVVDLYACHQNYKFCFSTPTMRVQSKHAPLPPTSVLLIHRDLTKKYHVFTRLSTFSPSPC